MGSLRRLNLKKKKREKVNMCLPCAYVADTHFRPKDFYQQVEAFEHFLNHCGVCHVLHCGDFFDSHNVGGEGVSTAEMITHLISIFQKFWFIHFYIVEGNHDQSSLGKPSAIDFFRGIKRSEDTRLNSSHSK